jgi:hypothetical protein
MAVKLGYTNCGRLKVLQNKVVRRIIVYERIHNRSMEKNT